MRPGILLRRDPRYGLTTETLTLKEGTTPQGVVKSRYWTTCDFTLQSSERYFHHPLLSTQLLLDTPVLKANAPEFHGFRRRGLICFAGRICTQSCNHDQRTAFAPTPRIASDHRDNGVQPPHLIGRLLLPEQKPATEMPSTTRSTKLPPPRAKTQPIITHNGSDTPHTYRSTAAFKRIIDPSEVCTRWPFRRVGARAFASHANLPPVHAVDR